MIGMTLSRMKRAHAIIAAWTMAMLITISGASAVIVQPDEPASEDTLIYEFLPTTALHGGFPTILAALSTDSGHDNHTLIRFNLASLPNQPLTSATLNLYVGDIGASGFGANPDAAHPVTVEVHANEGPFVEASATWGNAPMFDEEIVDLLLIDAINQWVSFEATSLVAAWLAAPASNFGFRLTGDGTRVEKQGVAVGVVFDSASTANKPFLDILYFQPGDTNGDGDVDADDLFNVKENFGDPGPSSPGDADGDGDTDIDDLVAVKNNYGTIPPGVAFVPEPATLTLLAAASLIALRRSPR